MFRRIIISLAGLLAVSAAAVIVDVNLPYKELRLKDGLLFTEVAVRSVNTAAGTVMLSVNKDLISVRTSLLPDDVRAKLQDLTPVQSPEELEAEKKQEAADRARAAENAERRQRQAEEEAKAARAASRDLNVKVAEKTAIQPDATVAEVAKFAENRAKSYFKYQDDPLSNIGNVIGSDIYLENPEPVPGWTGRYRVEGKAYRQFVNNQASGFGRGTKEFEMLIQTREGKKPEIVEVRIK
ncbi:hypothetical protein [Opitutus sp. GAS368]|uniref:hypothetical protein n=1 Tax=Opitutus sp. GAS368 TaxID=1882749 RepID=UPI00087BD48F|nr:hypothetical protein [Opitutus sp. GAS368]SDR80992.1 hypothetical protein SAMN05444173_0958 [Opitutus sp. GAS368]